ncbi:MAG: hypothetical protein J7641_13960 [Cyanobacteria bacterium SID2]|nr:hypothetical protein [Cyanobacteria bacterium SID2]MBP0002792.1 hypothetical protein [Cyanobacteria bacterium SBC]
MKNLLCLARLDRANISEGFQIYYLNDVLDDLAQELCPLALQAEVKPTFKSIAASKIKIQGNEAQLYRLLYNIASNAIQYTPSGGRVTIELDSTANEEIVRVRDTGIGISAED